jgi:ankyrin repeat protein
MRKPGITIIVTGQLTVFAIFYSAAHASQPQALIDAARQGDLKQVQNLLDGGADINTRGYYGATPLMAASSAGNFDVVKLLLGQGADLNAKNNKGSTALRLASEKGHIKIVELLKARGARVS